MKSAKVVLVVPPMLIRRCPLLGIAYLAAHLRARGHSVRVLDLNVLDDLPHADEEGPWSDARFVSRFFTDNEPTVSRWLDAILRDAPDVVAFSLWASTEAASLRLAEEIRRRGSPARIVFGGPHAGFAAEPLSRHPSVDALVLGEGEETLAELVEAFAAEKRPEAVPGAWLRSPSGVLRGERREEIRNLDALAFPDYADFDLDRYKMSDTLPLSFNRGCIRLCVFCNIHESWHGYRHRSAESIFREVRWQMERRPGVRHFEIDVAALNLNLKEIEKFCDLVLAEGVRFTWGGSAVFRPDMDRRLLGKMAAAGLRRLDVGFESGSPQVLRSMVKGYRIEHAERNLRDCRDAGIDVLLNVIVGFPGETEEDYRMTKEFLLRNRAFIAGTGPASEMYVGYNNAVSRQPEKFGIDPESLSVVNGLQLGDRWRSADGTNTRETRRRRAEDYGRWAVDNGFAIASNDVSRATC
jgi:radical SAM superfamily enzyme YgiQ (UPF0313 family)